MAEEQATIETIVFNDTELLYASQLNILVEQIKNNKAAIEELKTTLGAIENGSY